MECMVGGYHRNAIFIGYVNLLFLLLQKMDPSSSELQGTTYISAATFFGTDKYKAISFTNNFFRARPELFGKYAESLLYAEYSGRNMKSEALYDMFSQYIRTANPGYIQKKMAGEYIGTYEFTDSVLLQWSTVIKTNKAFSIYEPVMMELQHVLSTWRASDAIVHFNGRPVRLEELKPLMYTYSGESIYELFPYLAYVMTFLLHLKPYSFDEDHSASSAMSFHTRLNSWYSKCYEGLMQDFGFNPIDATMEDLSKIPDEVWIATFRYMLDPVRIIELRDLEMSQQGSSDLLQMCIEDQAAISSDNVKSAWNFTLDRMIEIIVENGPIRDLMIKIPPFDPISVNTSDLMTWTNYCLTGGNALFLIEKNREESTSVQYATIHHGDPGKYVSPSQRIFGNQELKSKINKFPLTVGKPFAASDTITDMCIAYLSEQFDNKRTDITDPYPITLSEEDIYSLPVSELLKNLFVQGIWMKDNSSLVKIFEYFETNQQIINELYDILALTKATQIVYNNYLGSTLITPYILSFVNEWILSHCVNNYPLRSFRPYLYLINTVGDYVDFSRLSFLANMASSLIYIHNNMYAQFVNMVVAKFTKILLGNPIIQQPFVKGLMDMAELYAIGGVELYNYAKYPNPFIRAYGFVTIIYGTSEELESFYAWISLLKDSSVFETIEDNKATIDLVNPILVSQHRSSFIEGKYPKILSNYLFASNGSYTLNNEAYHIKLKTTDGTYISNLLSKFIYPRSNTSGSRRSESILFRRLVLEDNQLTAKELVRNEMKYSDTEPPIAVNMQATGRDYDVPIYNYSGEVNVRNMLFVEPPKTRRHIKLKLFNSRTAHGINNVIWIFTSEYETVRYQSYIEIAQDNSVPTESTGSMQERINPKPGRLGAYHALSHPRTN